MDEYVFLCCDPDLNGSICVVDFHYNVLPFSLSSHTVQHLCDGSLRFIFEFNPEVVD